MTPLTDYQRQVEITKTRLNLSSGSARLASKVTLPSLYPKQQEIYDSRTRFNVLNIGRRAGKTYLGKYIAGKTVLAGQSLGWFAPNYKYLLEVWAELDALFKPIARKSNATERRIELKNGGLIECWTLDSNDDPGRSRKYHVAIVDEAAIAPNLKPAWEEAIRATLIDYRGSAWFLSTPKGINYFYDLFLKGQDPLQPDWKSWQLPSFVNPFLPVEELDELKATMTEIAYRQEVLAEFLQDEGAVFRNIDACLTSTPTTPGEHRAHTLVAGVDWGQQHDFTTISIYCCHCNREVYLDRFNQIDWSFQRGRLLTAISDWNVSLTDVETNSVGGVHLEQLVTDVRGMHAINGFEMTAKSKPRLIQALGLSFERNQSRWLPDAVARLELTAYEASKTPSGHTTYSAPSGGHDDTVIARALAWRLADDRMPIAPSRNEVIERSLPFRSRYQNAPSKDDPFYEGWKIERQIQRSAVEEKMTEAATGQHERDWASVL